MSLCVMGWLGGGERGWIVLIVGCALFIMRLGGTGE